MSNISIIFEELSVCCKKISKRIIVEDKVTTSGYAQGDPALKDITEAEATSAVTTFFAPVETEVAETATVAPTPVGVAAEAPIPVIKVVPVVVPAPPLPVMELAAPVAPPLPTVPTEQPIVDSAGHPWNAVQHSSSQMKNKDGTWKKRKRTAARLAGIPSPTIARTVNPPVPVAPVPTPITPDTVDFMALAQDCGIAIQKSTVPEEWFDDFFAANGVKDLLAIQYIPEVLKKFADAFYAKTNG